MRKFKQICVLESSPGYAYGMKSYIEDWMGERTCVSIHFKMDEKFYNMNWLEMDLLIVENHFVRSTDHFKALLEIKKNNNHLNLVLSISSTMLLMNEQFFSYEHFIFDGLVSKEMDKTAFISVMRKVLKIKTLIDV